MADVGRESASTQILNLIEFLSAYDAQRNPAVRNIADLRMYRLNQQDVPRTPAVRVRPSEDIWLRVDFVDLPAAPPVPPQVGRLLEPSEQLTADSEPAVVAMPPPPPPDARLSIDEQASAQQAHAESWRQTIAPVAEWVRTVWAPWAESYRLARSVKAVHRNLFEQRDRLTTERESIELVWGFGRLRWSTQGVQVDHPLISVPVEIDLLPGNQQIQVRPAGSIDVESRFLHGLALHDAAGYNAIKQSVINDGLDPWDPTQLAQVLRTLVRAVDDEGVLTDHAPARSASATVDPSWTLYVRGRAPDSQAFLSAMRDLYTADPAAVPAPLRAVMTTEEQTQTLDQTGERLLLPLATNEEQRRIVRLVQQHPGVTVQGPPGTGKSHTIANLISHYVAYGRRVLVVAEKEQALQVLTEKIPADIRDLTVAVLGADEVGRRRLETSIQQIQAGVGRVDRDAADRRIRELDARLTDIDAAIAGLEHQMLDARAVETRTLEGTTNPRLEGRTPGDAASWVADHASSLVHIPDELPIDSFPPITPGELAELRDLAVSIGSSRADQAGYRLPDLTRLPTADEFPATLDRLRALQAAVESIRGHLLVPGAVAVEKRTLAALAADLGQEVAWRDGVSRRWTGDVLRRLRDPFQRREWEGLREGLAALRLDAMGLRSTLRAHQVQVPDQTEPGFLTDLQEAAEKLRTDGKLGMFARDAKKAVALCLVDGHPPNSAAEVDLCLQQLRLTDIRRGIATRWLNEAQQLGAAPLGSAPEEDLLAAIDELTDVLAADERFADLTHRLRQAGVVAPPDPSGLALAASACRTAAAIFDVADVEAEMARLAEYLQRGGATDDASVLWRNLEEALVNRSVERWQANVAAVAQLADVAPSALRLRTLRDRLGQAAPLWTRRLLADSGAAGDPVRLPDAWLWRQLDGWVAGVLALPSTGDLQHQIDELVEERSRVVVDLVGERAWRRLVDAIGSRERQALTAYLKAVNRFGKTGGKFAQRWIEEMRAALDEAKTAVPVWIMPTARALTSFRPTAEPPFDVIVIDEASQINFSALPLLSLAKSAIVVGDDKQTSPENVGLDRAQIFGLMDNYLSAVPKYRTLFDPDNSLYDLAVQKFPDVVMLTEHFRCLPEIIGFSNSVAYDGRIIPLRDRRPHPGWTPLGVLRVRNGQRQGDINEAEAQAVVDLIAQLCADPEYDGMTFGVVSLLGTQQSKRINDLMYDRLGLDAIEKRRIRCGEPANFQGDERDVMVLSTVIAKGPDTRIGAMTSARDLRRMNVAASRARSQLWVVTSVGPEDLHTDDLRGRLITYCSEPAAPIAPDEAQRQACESELERQVLDRLRHAGFADLQVQHPVGRHRIDLVVTGPDGRLAIEADSDTWRGAEAWQNERSSVQVLERAGWSFERVRASSFFRDPDAAMEAVFDRLALVGVRPGTQSAAAPRTVRREVTIDGFDASPVPSTLTPRIVPAEQTLQVDEPTHVSAREWAPPEWYSRSHSAEESPPVAAPTQQARETPRPLSQIETPVDDDSWAPPAWYRDEPTNTSFAGSEDADDPDTVQTTVVGEFALPPYATWTSRSVPVIDPANREGMVLGLLDIVGTEGPMLAGRAFQLYARAAGNDRTGSGMKRILGDAMQAAIRTGRLARVADRARGEDITLFLPDTPAVLVRERGPRQLIEIPPTEVRALMDQLGINGSLTEADRRAVQNAYGIGRLTVRARDYLRICESA
jgi:hypothetical protein